MAAVAETAVAAAVLCHIVVVVPVTLYGGVRLFVDRSQGVLDLSKTVRLSKPEPTASRYSCGRCRIYRIGRRLRARAARLSTDRFRSRPPSRGLAAAFKVGGTRIERFYHHWFTNDHHIGELVRELGLEDRLVYRATRTGMYFANRLYRLSTPLDVLRLPVLSLADRLRLGLTLLRARRVRDWREIDHVGAAEWMRKLGGDAAFRVIWEPLLRNKFGPHAEDVSAAWFWSKLRLRGGSRGARGEERLAYFRGGFAALADELVGRIVEPAERCA